MASTVNYDDYDEKQEFVAHLETVLKMAKPNIRRVTFLTGEQYNKNFTPDDELVAVTMNNGYDYVVNVTCNSLMDILYDVAQKIKNK